MQETVTFDDSTIWCGGDDEILTLVVGLWIFVLPTAIAVFFLIRRRNRTQP